MSTQHAIFGGPTPTVIRRFVCAALVCAATATPASAAEEPAAADAEAAEATPAAVEKKPFALELGDFHVRDWRPTRNETPDLRFSVVVVFAAETPDLVRQRLEHWVNRLRDQTIVAVRLVEAKDFAEPDLQQMKRLIQVRISRLLPRLPVEAVLITDFALGDD